jgi:hypothetical protein
MLLILVQNWKGFIDTSLVQTAGLFLKAVLYQRAACIHSKTCRIDSTITCRKETTLSVDVKLPLSISETDVQDVIMNAVRGSVLESLFAWWLYNRMWSRRETVTLAPL